MRRSGESFAKRSSPKKGTIGSIWYGTPFTCEAHQHLAHVRREVAADDREALAHGRQHRTALDTGKLRDSMPIRAVVFDLFDTLVDLHMDRLPPVEVEGKRYPSTAGHLHALVRECADVRGRTSRRRSTPSSARCARRAPSRAASCRRSSACRRSCGGSGCATRALAERLTDTHMGLLREQVTTHPHHVGVLEQLRGQVKLAVCSNFSHSQTALRILEDAGLRWYFDAVLVSDATGYRKPRREIFDATCAVLGVGARRNAARRRPPPARRGRAAGRPACARPGSCAASPTRRPPLREHAGPAPSHVIRDLAEVPGLVTALA